VLFGSIRRPIRTKLVLGSSSAGAATRVRLCDCRRWQSDVPEDAGFVDALQECAPRPSFTSMLSLGRKSNVAAKSER